jgi:hypothetical protein
LHLFVFFILIIVITAPKGYGAHRRTVLFHARTAFIEQLDLRLYLTATADNEDFTTFSAA